MEGNYKKIYTGSETECIAIKKLLEENQIQYIEKNHLEAGLRGGFYGGMKGVEIQVLEEKYSTAEKLIEAFLAENKD
ncbi:MAG: putative signal transducing protein [Bacteroidota bacterium]